MVVLRERLRNGGVRGSAEEAIEQARTVLYLVKDFLVDTEPGAYNSIATLENAAMELSTDGLDDEKEIVGSEEE